MTPSCPVFASRTLAIHLLRGGVGFLALAGALLLVRDGRSLEMVGAAPAVLAALFLLRGCPMCWVIGLVETVTGRPRQ